MSEPTAGPALAVRSGLARGRLLFNRGDFWGSHEVLEGAWRRAEPAASERIHGLIQAAAALHHIVVRDNPHGARHLFDRSLERLAGARDGELGIAWRPLVAELERWRVRIGHDGIAAGGPIVGLPRIEWSAEGDRDRLSVDVVRLMAVEHDGTRTILVQVTAEDATGWGECRLEWGRFGQWESLRDLLAPSLLAEPLAAPSELAVRWADLGADRSAAAGLEAAVWDAWSRRAGVSLVAALGLALRAVDVAGSVPAGDTRPLVDGLAACLRRGYRHVVVPARPNADRRIVPALVHDCPVPFAIDLGQAYRSADVEALRVLDGLGASCLARPVHRTALRDAARLARWLATPVALAGWLSPAALEGALDADACDVVQLDPSAAGLTAALDMLELAEVQRRPVWVAARAATTVGAQAALALAAHPGVDLLLDLPADPPPEPPRGGAAGGRDGGAPLVALDGDGRASPPSGTGSGAAPDPAWLAAVVRRRAELRA